MAAGILALIAKIWLRLQKFRNHSENFAMHKFSLYSEITIPRENGCLVFLMFLIPNDHVLIIYHFVPIVITYFRHFWFFTHLGWLYKPPYDFCNPNF